MATSKQASPILPSPKIEEPRSDTPDLVGSTDTHPVMAEATSRDVVNQSLSVGDHSPADVPVTNYHESATRGDEVKQSSSEQEGIPHEFQHGGPVKAVDAIVAPTTENIESVNGRLTPSSASYINGGAQQTGLLSENRSTDIQHDGGSDTDTGRADGARSADITGAAKKTTFKPVSFAKYSVSKVVSAAPSAKAPGEKAAVSTSSPTPTLQSTARPRLIAKSGSGLRDSEKTFKPASTNGAGPDPMQVWNKNRATPAPSTKHLTDEELKLQYGIHMTSRIQAGDDGKEAKWADIDDDEDDWAPETIEWNDGTKTSLGQDLPVPAKDTKPIPPPTEIMMKPAAERPVLNLQPKSVVGPNATILKLGQNAEKQAKAIASQPKGLTGGSTVLPSKAAAPVPAKSPWAPLPPVNKSPISVNPEPPASAARGYFPTTSQQPSSSAVQSPATEISADDFNRNWRDAQTTGPRELYMPNSGRYEAVGDGRRRMSRNDQNQRQPAVLQRPGQSGPAEPSAAFQTSRVSADQERSTWGRRRASSNLSGGSGQYGRRMSIGRSSDMPYPPNEQPQQHQRHASRGLANMPHSYQAHEQARGISPAQLSTDHRQLSHDSPRLSHVSSDAVGSPAPTVAEMAPIEEDPVTVQKRVMALKREEARARRQEEEQREEAARRERIRLKLEALGPAPTKSHTEKVAASPAAVSAVPPTSTAPLVQATREVPVKGAEDSTIAAMSPPKPPVPEASGAPKQYGMMKVHHPDTVKKTMLPQSMNQQQHPQSREPASPGQQKAPHMLEARSDPLRPSEPAVDGIRQNSDDSVQQLGQTRDKVARTWNDTALPGQSPSPWAAPRPEQQRPKHSVWGNNNALGNGTFDRSLAEFGALRGQLPPPIQSGRSTLWAPERSPFPGMDPTNNATLPPVLQDPAQTVPPFPLQEDKPLAADSEADSIAPISRPMPIGPPQPHPASAGHNVRLPSTGISAWNSFQNVAAREDRAANDRFRQEAATRLDEESRPAFRQIPPPVTYNETWRQVDPGNEAGQRQVVNVSRSSGMPPQAVAPFGPAGQDLMVPKSITTTNGGQKASRFFPHGGANGLIQQERRAVTYSHPEPPSSPSPPPPEELGHPAFTGNTSRPQVNFPKPRAVVKLPPKDPLPSPPAPPVQRPPPQPQTWSAVVGSRAVSMPVARSDSKQQSQLQSWQSRFNALLDKKDLSDKKQALAVASSTRDMLDVLAEAEMTVSLPTSGLSSLTTSSGVTTKDVEEEDEIFEDRVPGSLPVVNVPMDVSALVMQPLPSARHKNRPVKVPDTVTARFFTFDPHPSDRENIIIHLPGSVAERKAIASKRVDHGGAIAKPTRQAPHKGRKGPKSREPSGNFKQHQPHSPRGDGSQQAPVGPHASSPRAPLSQQSSGWRGSRQTAGVAH